MLSPSLANHDILMTKETLNAVSISVSRGRSICKKETVRGKIRGLKPPLDQLALTLLCPAEPM